MGRLNRPSLGLRSHNANTLDPAHQANVPTPHRPTPESTKRNDPAGAESLAKAG